MKPDLIESELLTVAAVAPRLGLSVCRVFALIRAGKLPAVKTGTRSVRIPRVAFETYLRGLNEAALESMQPKPLTLADLLATVAAELPAPIEAKTAEEVLAALGSGLLSRAALPAAEDDRAEDRAEDDKAEDAGKHMRHYLNAHARH